MAVPVKNTSRLLFADLVIVDGVEFWDVLDLPPYKPREGDIPHVVRGHDRIDLLAQKYYRDPVLWWVIAWANDLEILPTQLVVGASITVPDPNYVSTILFNKKRKV